MRSRIAVVGVGAVGGYVGGYLARNGQDVTLIDPWPAHVKAIRTHELELAWAETGMSWNWRASRPRQAAWSGWTRST